MLTVYPSKGGEQAKSYFFSSLSYGDYYTEGQEKAGLWWGKGAQLLGLSGRVGTREFCRLVDNQHPFTRERLTLRNDADRRAGYDLTFSACKSLSIAAMLFDDPRLIEAVENAVKVALAEAEEMVKTRVRKNGSIADRYTNNLTAALFTHLTARPEGGQVPDMQVHVHAYLVNATLDTEEQVWKAIEPEQLAIERSFIEAVFHNDLARRVQELGYAIVPKGKFWEIKHIPDTVIKTFSKRSERINAVAEERGIDNPADKADVGRKTRRGKAPQYSMSELRDAWWEQVSAKEAKRMESARPQGRGWKATTPDERQHVANQIVNSVAASIFERSSTVTERKFLDACLRRSLGRVNAEELRAAVPRAGLTVKDYKGTRRVTHPEVYKEEQDIVAITKRGKGCFKQLSASPKVPEGLTRDQALAYRHIVTSRDKFIMVEGAPGTGKTTLAAATRATIHGRLREVLSPVVGDKLVVLAPTTIASRVVLRKDGFKEADTIARFLRDEELQAKAFCGWVLVDEASQLGTREGRELAEKLDALMCRAIFVGDRKQNRAVSRGSTFDLMIEEAGCKSHRMEEIVRQKGRQLDIVNTIVSGNVRQGLAAINNDGDLHVIDGEPCKYAAAAEYVKQVKEKKKVVLVTPTHDGAEAVTSYVRQEMKAAERLKGGHTYRTWVGVKRTAEENRDAANYKVGQMVQLNRPIEGFDFGKHYNVFKVGTFPFVPSQGMVQVRAPGELPEAFPVHLAERFAVYEPKEIEVCKGDLIRITRTVKVQSVWGKFRSEVIDQFELPEKHAAYKTVELENGTVHKVIGFSLKGDIILEGQKILPRDFGHFTHGYCLTTQAAQSMTVDSSILVGTKDQLQALDRSGFLSSATRAKTSFKVFTDDPDALLEAASREDTEVSATELVEHGHDVGENDRRAEEERAEFERHMEWERETRREEGHAR